MSDDRKPKPKAFNLDSESPTAFTLRDLDNAQPRLRPRGLVPDHPRLAPPGMVGIKINKQPWTHQARHHDTNINVTIRVSDAAPRSTEKTATSARPRLELGSQDEAKRAFEPLVRNQPIKGRGFER